MKSSPETQLLCELAAGRTPPEPPAASWKKVYALAESAGLAALVHRNAAHLMPAAIEARFAECARESAFSTLRTLQERDRVLTQLADADVGPVVLLKGSVTGWLVYPDPMLRPMHDIDILLPDERIEQAADILTAAGYREIDNFKGRRVSGKSYFERVFARELVPNRVNQVIELHSAFAQRTRYPIDYSAVIGRAIRFTDGGPGAFRLDEADQLIHLAIHLALDQFQGPLKHLLGLHLWIERGRFAWDDVVAKVRVWGAAGTVFTALRLSHEVFGTQIPDDVLASLKPGPIRERYLRWWHTPSADRLVRFEVPIRRAQLIALPSLLDTAAQRARFLGHYAALRVLDALGR
jgi:hypothetical protein